MQETKWRVVIADMPHRDDLFAEIWINDEQMAEVFFDDHQPVIEIYPHPHTQVWKFDYSDLVSIVQQIDRFLDSLKQTASDVVKPSP